MTAFTNTLCPSLDDLLDPVLNEVPMIEEHLGICPRCRALRALEPDAPRRRWRQRRRLWADELLVTPRAGRPLVMPDRVQTGDIWQLVGQQADERYVAVIAGLIGDVRPLFTLAGTTPDLEFAGTGDVVVKANARAIRVGYPFLLCTWSFAGAEERQFEQYLGRVDAAARRALLAAHRVVVRAEEGFAVGPDHDLAIDDETAIRASFRWRLQRRLDADLIQVDPREASLPIPADTLLDRRPPAWLTALASHFGRGDVPHPYEVARILRMESVGWLPSTKRNVKWLFLEHATREWWEHEAEAAPQQLPPGTTEQFDFVPEEIPRRAQDRERIDRERAAESYARDVERHLEERYR